MVIIYPLIAVLFGFMLVLVFKSNRNHLVKLLLPFSGAFLLALTFFELLPEVYGALNSRLTGILIMSGILLQIVLEFFSKGAEHGHIHTKNSNKNFPWLLFISLCIHSLLEGFPIKDSNDIVYGIIIHKIPVAILILTFLLESKFSNFQISFFLIVFALMTPFGTLISNYSNLISGFNNYVNGLSIGIFLHISTVILFESSEGHKVNLQKLLLIGLGVLTAYFI